MTIRSRPALEAGTARPLARASARLLAEHGPIAAAWGKASAVVSQTGLAAEIPPATALLQTPLLRGPFVSMFVDQAHLPYDRYCHEVRVISSAGPELVLDTRLVENELASGASVRFNRLELWCDPVGVMANAVSGATGMRVIASGFYSARGQRMLPWHRDPHHALALQVEGEKRWNLGGPYPEDLSVPYNRISAAEGARTVLLRPDDVLYLPQAFAHCAAADSEMSFHVTIAVVGPSVGDVRSRVLQLLTEKLDLDDPGEVRPDNVARVLASVCGTLSSVQDRLARATDAGESGSDEISTFRDWLCDTSRRIGS